MTEQTGFADETEAEEVLQPRAVKPRKPVFKVRRVTDTGEDPMVAGAKFDTLAEARHFVVLHHPRGREVYVEHPDGYKEHYSADLHAQGHDKEGWQELTEDEVE